jgi:hypothetical protein
MTASMSNHKLLNYNRHRRNMLNGLLTTTSQESIFLGPTHQKVHARLTTTATCTSDASRFSTYVFPSCFWRRSQNGERKSANRRDPDRPHLKRLVRFQRAHALHPHLLRHLPARTPCSTRMCPPRLATDPDGHDGHCT